MLRKVLTSITIVEALWPETLIDAAEEIALDNPDKCELKPWVVPGARLEGLVFLVLMWRSDTSYSRFKKLLGVIGILALLYPRAYVDYAAEIAYTDTATCEWKSWVYPGTRLIGLLYVSIALTELRKR